MGCEPTSSEFEKENEKRMKNKVKTFSALPGKILSKTKERGRKTKSAKTAERQESRKGMVEETLPLGG